jgi:hypothetical protein
MVASRQRLIPHRLTELGRLRLGDRQANSNGRGWHPHKLTAFRLTSSNRSLLQYAAAQYGGAVEPWDDDWAPKDEHGRPTQWELYTTATAMDILVPTFSAISLSYERWSASGCQQRCTGTLITACPLNEALVGTPCTCPADDAERTKLATTGKACARILRLNVLLPDLPGIGSWRLETKGFYATSTLMGSLDLLQMAGQEHQIIEAVLLLEQRTVKRPGTGEGTGTLQFVVPVIWPKTTPRALLAKAEHVLFSPLSASASPPALREAITDLYGGTAAEPPLVQRINTLLRDQGQDADAIAAYWGRMTAKYPDIHEPTTLSMLYEKLEAAVAEAPKPPAAQTAPAQVPDARTVGRQFLETHQQDTRLPEPLRERIANALAPLAPAPDFEVAELVDIVAQWLDTFAETPEGNGA